VIAAEMAPVQRVTSRLSSDNGPFLKRSEDRENRMNKRVARESVMSDDNRIVKLESDVHHLQSDVTEIKEDVKSLRTLIEALRSEFLTFKAEVAKEFGSVTKEFGSVAWEFGMVRASIERAKLWMVVTGVGMILSVWGAALALARFLRP
jgi:predicted RNase H-like nuclease (RuvC/YqgF family)